MLAHKDAEAKGLGPQTQLLLHCFGHGEHHMTGNMKLWYFGEPCRQEGSFS